MGVIIDIVETDNFGYKVGMQVWGKPDIAEFAVETLIQTLIGKLEDFDSTGDLQDFDYNPDGLKHNFFSFSFTMKDERWSILRVEETVDTIKRGLEYIMTKYPDEVFLPWEGD